MKIRNIIKQLILSIAPYDDLEAEQIIDIIKWIESGEEIFRIQKPAIPPKHLVSYFVIIDSAKRKILLMDHIKAGLWLPGGGHIEKDEHPKAAVEREIFEELNITAEFISESPFFITQTITVGKTAGHTDVSLWYLLLGDSRNKTNYDPEEFNGYKWFEYEEIINNDGKGFDPHMQRFIKKFLSSESVL